MFTYRDYALVARRLFIEDRPSTSPAFHRVTLAWKMIPTVEHLFYRSSMMHDVVNIVAQRLACSLTLLVKKSVRYHLSLFELTCPRIDIHFVFDPGPLIVDDHIRDTTSRQSYYLRILVMEYFPSRIHITPHCLTYSLLA